MRIAILIFLLSCISCTKTVVDKEYLKSSPVIDFRLEDQNGYFHHLYGQKLKKAVVLVSVSLDCPVSLKYISTLEKLKNDFQNRVSFFYIDANLGQDFKEVQDLALKNNVTIPILMDKDQTISHSLGFTRTAEAIVIDTESWRTLYKGSIDDSVEFESEKPKQSEILLEKQIQRILKGSRKIELKEHWVGCSISYAHNLTNSNVSYESDLRPIFVKNCYSCHNPSGSSFDFDGLVKFKRWSAMINEVIRTKRMPPWNAYSDFTKIQKNANLTVDDKQKIYAWLNTGGKKDEKPVLHERKVESKKDWELGKPYKIVQLKTEKLPKNGPDFYRYQVIALENKKPILLSGVEFQSKNTKLLHHAIVMFSRKKPTINDSLEEFEVIGSYLPGIEQNLYPFNTALELPVNSWMIVSLHYGTLNEEAVDDSRIGLFEHTNKIVKKLNPFRNYKTDIVIPPNTASFKISKEIFKVDKKISIVGMAVHMHARGVYAEIVAEKDGIEKTLLKIPYYNSRWQKLYVPDKPIELGPGYRIICRGIFDNSAANPLNPNPNQEVRWGMLNENEMFICPIRYF